MASHSEESHLYFPHFLNIFSGPSNTLARPFRTSLTLSHRHSHSSSWVSIPPTPCMDPLSSLDLLIASKLFLFTPVLFNVVQTPLFGCRIKCIRLLVSCKLKASCSVSSYSFLSAIVSAPSRLPMSTRSMYGECDRLVPCLFHFHIDFLKILHSPKLN